MRTLYKLFSGILIVLCVSIPAYAERPEHFKGKPSETLSAALTNFDEYNAQLSALIKKSDLKPADMVKVHELTYTLENALEKIRSELETLAETLEEVHIASERLDAETVRTQGRRYLTTATEIVRQP